jgi:hypothetical protein
MTVATPYSVPTELPALHGAGLPSMPVHGAGDFDHRSDRPIEGVRPMHCDDMVNRLAWPGRRQRRDQPPDS